MLIYAGIDEAGYGPMFGPLTIARTVFAIDRDDLGEELPSLWGLLKAAVCRKPSDKKRRVAINDSKLLHTPHWGLTQLERGVLAFLATLGARPRTTAELLEAIGYDPASRQPDQLWYLDEAGGPALPHALDPGRLRIASGLAERCCTRERVRLADLSTAVIFEDRFNEMVRATRSKAGCAWTFVSGHLAAIWQRFGEHGPRVVVDRQGGRTFYSEPLMTLFPEAKLRIVEETPLISEYELIADGRSMRVAFMMDSEAHHLPVALASMAAKYTRELLMQRFAAFWQAQAPETRPTAGYFGDGRRFLREIEPVIERLGIDRHTLIRRG